MGHISWASPAPIFAFTILTNAYIKFENNAAVRPPLAHMSQEIVRSIVCAYLLDSLYLRQRNVVAEASLCLRGECTPLHGDECSSVLLQAALNQQQINCAKANCGVTEGWYGYHSMYVEDSPGVSRL